VRKTYSHPANRISTETVLETATMNEECQKIDFFQSDHGRMSGRSSKVNSKKFCLSIENTGQASRPGLESFKS